MLNDKHYGQENILIHEFAHSVMCIGMDDEQRHSICAAFLEAQQSGCYQRHIYMMENADEYWAEATQSWFDATIRTGKCMSCMPHSWLLNILILLAGINVKTHTDSCPKCLM